ncbi:MAG: alcohol dehydrogenase catalytic domain-containing protein [Candidatus Poribacteria bacterium]|nr:alcohol dehydrogenase catalytic domain-containing protein [Candidatus Poribacteria bacterium]
MKQKYRAAVLHSAGEIQIDERSFSPLQSGEAVIRVQFAGVCGTDIALFSGDYPVPLPLVLGHEFAGEVVEVASKADAGWIGKRVTAEINNTCWAYRKEKFCLACGKGLSTHCTERTVVGIINYDGAYAEYLRVPVGNLHALPDGVSWETGVFIEPLAAAIQTFEITPITPSNRIVVLGVGRLGLLICAVAAFRGAQVCAVSRSQSKLDRALAWGVTAAIRAGQPDWIAAVREWTGGLGADIVVEATGSPEGLSLASEVVRPRGTIALKSTCGLPASGIDVTKLVVDEVQIHTSRCGPFAKAIGLLTRQPLPVGSLVSEIYPLDQVSQAIERAKWTTKILIQPNG